MFSDFKSRGFGIQETQIQYPDRLGRLILVMSLALYGAVSTEMWDAAENPTPAEKRSERQPRKLARSKLSWFTRGLRKAISRLCENSVGCDCYDKSCYWRPDQR
jgi:hypothetical protein